MKTTVRRARVASIVIFFVIVVGWIMKAIGFEGSLHVIGLCIFEKFFETLKLFFDEFFFLNFLMPIDFTSQFICKNNLSFHL